jgi:outer membrane lipoprotein SlyB
VRAGAIVGGIGGGVIGHQLGSGRGNTAATIAGAGAGALAGNEIEKRRGDEGAYRITVRFRDGREGTFVQDDLNGLRVGDPVRVDAGRLYRY